MASRRKRGMMMATYSKGHIPERDFKMRSAAVDFVNTVSFSTKTKVPKESVGNWCFCNRDFPYSLCKEAKRNLAFRSCFSMNCTDPLHKLQWPSKRIVENGVDMMCFKLQRILIPSHASSFQLRIGDHVVQLHQSRLKLL
jgi:hypothetical protein